jgi:alpha-tubulin suppressor-like RCC1 family protein
VTSTDSVGFDAHEMGNALPPIVVAPIHVRAASVGKSHACAIMEEGNLLKCWGSAGKGATGIATAHGDVPFSMGPYLPPVDLGLMANESWIPTKVAVGGAFTCVVLSDSNSSAPDRMKCFGDNSDCALMQQRSVSSVGEDSSTMGQALPDSVLPDGVSSVKSMCAGNTFACAIFVKQSPWGLSVGCWGTGLSGELGSKSTSPVGCGFGDKPVVHEFEGRIIEDLSCGEEHVCVVVESRVRCWGKANDGRLGYQANQAWPNYPDPELDQVKNIGDAFSDTNISSLPAVLLGTIGTQIGAKSVHCGGQHTCAILQNDRVVCFGSNSAGQLGLDTTDTPIFGKKLTEYPSVYVTMNPDSPVREVAAGSRHTCFLGGLDEFVRCFGDNSDFQLGVPSGTTTVGRRQQGEDKPMAAAAPILVPGAQVEAIRASGETTCALLRSERILCWGSGEEGQLGQGYRDSSSAIDRNALIPLGTCGAGSGVTGSTFACAACRPGYVKTDDDSQNTCQPCPKGWHAPDSGLSKCMPCPAGHYADTAGTQTCTPCEAGSFANSTGTESCQQCRPGTVALNPGKISCDECPPGTFASTPGLLTCERCGQFEFSGSFRTVSCNACPSQSTSAPAQGRECRCDETLYLTLNNTCETCPVGAFCKDGRLLGAEDGWWQSDDPENFDSVTKCPNFEACLGFEDSPDKKCADGHVGPVCAQCNESWYISPDQSCKECPESAGTGAILAVFVVVVVAGGIFVLWRFWVEMTLIVTRESEEDNEKNRDGEDDAGGNEGGDSGGGSINWRGIFDVGKLRVLIGFLQVFSALGKTFDVPW